MRIILFVSVLGILASIAVLISVIIKSNKDASEKQRKDKDTAGGR